MTKSTSDEYFELTPTINSWDTVQIKIIWWDSYNYAIYSSVYVATAETYKKNVIPITPSSITSIWNVWTWFIFWMQDWVFKWWFMLSKETTATTWNVTLWNAVWYIKVNLNGEIVKIPYYNE